MVALLWPPPLGSRSAIVQMGRGHLHTLPVDAIVAVVVATVVPLVVATVCTRLALTLMVRDLTSSGRA